MVWYHRLQQEALMKQDQDSPYQHHLFVCEGGPCSTARESQKGGGVCPKDVLKENFKKRGLKGIVRVSKSSCLGQCDHAPNIMDYPSGTWYREVSQDDLAAIEGDVLKRLGH